MDRQEQQNIALGRYKDLYRHAHGIVGFGNTVKVLGWIAGLLVVGASLMASGDGGVSKYALVPGVIVGAIVLAVLFALGVVICASGQVLLAQADSAVFACPFLSDDDRGRLFARRTATTTHAQATNRQVASQPTAAEPPAPVRPRPQRSTAASAVRTCTKCGEMNAGTARVCSGCGASL